MGFTLDAYITIGLLHFVLPFVLVYIVDVIFRKYGLIKRRLKNLKKLNWKTLEKA